MGNHRLEIQSHLSLILNQLLCSLHLISIIKLNPTKNPNQDPHNIANIHGAFGNNFIYNVRGVGSFAMSCNVASHHGFVPSTCNKKIEALSTGWLRGHSFNARHVLFPMPKAQATFSGTPRLQQGVIQGKPFIP